MAIQTVTRYIEQRKAQFSEQKRATSRRVVRKVSKENTRTSRDMSNTAKAGETDAPPSVSKMCVVLMFIPQVLASLPREPRSFQKPPQESKKVRIRSTHLRTKWISG